MNLTSLPSNLVEAIRYFADDQNCHDFLSSMRWPDGVCCAHCQSENVGKLVVSQAARRGKSQTGYTTRRLWNCKACHKQFTVKTGTIFEDSALGLEKWLPAVWMICNAKNGVSSCELSRALGVTQKTAWFMGHRIRLAMREGGFELSGDIEADGAYIGGSTAKMNKATRDRLGKKTDNKTAVLGVLERSDKKHGSKVLLEVIDSENTAVVQRHIRNRVKRGAAIYTDAHGAYVSLQDDYKHEFIDHALAYARGKVHTNGMENFWSLLKRTIRGTYIQISPMHLFRYLDEQATRFNERADDDHGRFLSAIQRVSGRRLPYWALTNVGFFERI